MSNQTPLTPQQKNFKYQIWLMLIIVVGVIATGFLMIPKTEQQRQQMIDRLGTTNMGQLVSPSADLSSLLAPLTNEDKPKWQIVIVSGQICDDSCMEILKTPDKFIYYWVNILAEQSVYSCSINSNLMSLMLILSVNSIHFCKYQL